MKWVDSHEAAGILRTTPDLACVLARRKLIPAMKRGKIWVFPAEQLIAFAAAHDEISLKGLNANRRA